MAARRALILACAFALSTAVGGAGAAHAAAKPDPKAAARPAAKPSAKPVAKHAPKPTPEPASTPATEPAPADCAAAAPEATLQPGVYPQQSFRRLSDNRARETAMLARHVRLDVDYAGCADVVARTVTLRVDDPRRGHREPRVWAAFLADALQRLHAVPERRWFEPGLLRFLVEASAQHGKPGAIERCADGSRPDAAECAFATGGGYRFEVREARGSTTVVVRQYNWL